jgi:putative endonuclease
MTFGGVVYIMTNKHHTALYTGVTSDLIVRLQQHINKEFDKSFTSKYNIYKLVYYKTFSTILEAIAEEKRIKGGSRQKKIDLINGLNPQWTDLWVNEVSKW